MGRLISFSATTCQFHFQLVSLSGGGTGPGFYLIRPDGYQSEPNFLLGSVLPSSIDLKSPSIQVVLGKPVFHLKAPFPVACTITVLWS